MKALEHLLLTNNALVGPQYGVLRDFEDEICRITGAATTQIPQRKLPGFINQRIAHGTRFQGLRDWIPKPTHALQADVLWLVMMGPENYSLDLFKEWDDAVGIKILYLFDTFENQVPSIRRVLKSAKWDIAITSFSGAELLLEEQTQHPWHVVPQGVKLARFQPPKQEKNISFCAYGRRLDRVHYSIKKYCQQLREHYDYSIAASYQRQLDPRDNYDIYSWHLNQSLFNFCWPVELTHPKRVLSFSPITCRWFEAAASGNVILGQAPQDSGFNELFGPDLVTAIDPNQTEEALVATWEGLWQNRQRHADLALQRRANYAHKWSWESRVQQILALVEEL